MRKRLLLLLLATLALLALAAAPSRPQEAEAYTLIAEVNALRAENGLPPYQVNPILMAVCQAHAEYMARTGTVTHYSADGSRPFQRALAAGYPVAGDLSLGGFYSENIVAGYQLSEAQAVVIWQGDAPHLNTMLSDHLTEVGAGVAFSGETIYYVLDAARPANGAVAYTPPTDAAGTPVTLAPPVVPVSVTSTPQADGRVVHTVQAGQTLWTIAAVYGVPLDTLIAQNNLPANGAIYPGQELLIRAGSPTTEAATASPTPTVSPTVTPSPPAPRRSATPSPVATASPSPASPSAPASTPASASDHPLQAGLPLFLTLAAALILATLVTLRTGRK